MPTEDQLRRDSFQKMEHKLSISQKPFVQITGVMDKIILEAYFCRNFLIIFKVTSRTLIFSGFLGRKFYFFAVVYFFFFFAVLSVFHLCLKRIYFGRLRSWL